MGHKNGVEKYKINVNIGSSIYTRIIFTNYKFWIIFIVLKFINPHTPQTYHHILGIIIVFSTQSLIKNY